MNQVMETILHRRSIRKFKSEQLSQEHLDMILTAGTYAPSAGGRQSPVIVACQNAEINNELGLINADKLREILDKRPPMDPNDKTQKAAPKLNPDMIRHSTFQGAPTVVTLFAPKNWYNFILDCAVAAENMMLAADSLGVGSCMIARAEETFATERGRQIQAAWGIGEEYEAKVHVILGYPDGDIPAAKPRKEDHIIVIN